MGWREFRFRGGSDEMEEMCIPNSADVFDITGATFVHYHM